MSTTLRNIDYASLNLLGKVQRVVSNRFACGVVKAPKARGRAQSPSGELSEGRAAVEMYEVNKSHRLLGLSRSPATGS